jgi:hypothetical protein
VVPLAEVGQILQLRDPGAAEGVAVVSLQVPPDVAAGNDALAVADVEGGAEVRRDRVAAVGDSDDVDAPGDEHLQDGVFAQLAGQRHRDRADAGDLALLAGHGVAPHQGVIVDDDMEHAVGPGGCGAVGTGQVDQGVGPVGVATLEPATPDRVGHYLVGAPVNRSSESGQLVRGAAEAHMAHAISVNPVPDLPAPVYTAMAVVLIDDRRRLYSAALLLEAPQTQLSGRFNQLLLGLGHLGGHLGDLPRLGLRQQPGPECRRDHRQAAETVGHLHGGNGWPKRCPSLRRHPCSRGAEPFTAPQGIAFQCGGCQHPQCGEESFGFSAPLDHPSRFLRLQAVDVRPGHY